MDSMAISMVLQVLGNRRRLLTLAFAFPVLRSCGDWMNRIAALENAMHLNTTEMADLQAMAAAMAEDLMAPTYLA